LVLHKTKQVVSAKFLTLYSPGWKQRLNDIGNVDKKMRPDYSHKLFTDKRGSYCLLMESLAMDHTAAYR